MPFQEEAVLAIGSGQFLLSLAESWYASGLSKFTVYVTNKEPADLEKLMQLMDQAPNSKIKASLAIIPAEEDKVPNWRAVVQPFEFILYVSDHGDLDELRDIQQACLAEKKQTLPAVAVRGMGMAGPLLHPDGQGLWESAWLNIHSSVFPGTQTPKVFSSSAAALLSVLLVHECHKMMTGEQELASYLQCFLLDPATLTGSWFPVPSPPLDSVYSSAHPIKDLKFSLGENDEQVDPEIWFTAFEQMTSKVTGIFHVWEEADLIQLPLAQCLVQPVDPLSKGPADLLPIVIRSGFTHLEARKESGLAGLEAYAARLIPLLFAGFPTREQEKISIGAGCNITEAVWRGVRSCIAKEFSKRLSSDEPVLVQRIENMTIEDTHCRYYFEALTALDEEAFIAAGEPILGFPAVWVYSDSSWYSSVDLSFTLALRRSLEKALRKSGRAGASPIFQTEPNEVHQNLTISDGNLLNISSLTLSAIETLQRFDKRLVVFEIDSKPLWGKGPFVVSGVAFGEEESLEYCRYYWRGNTCRCCM